MGESKQYQGKGMQGWNGWRKSRNKGAESSFVVFSYKRGYKGAMHYFMDFYNKRPDVLMEASDVTGELHLMLQITAVMDMQIKREGGSFTKAIRMSVNGLGYFRI